MPQNPESSKITTRPPAAQMTAAMVQPPSRVYITRDDRLYIRSRNSVTAVTLTVAGRLLTAAGEIVPFNFTHVPATDRTSSLASFNLAEGFLLSVVVFPAVGAPLRGQTFVEIGLLRGLSAAASVVDVLARDYVAEGEPLAFPGGAVRSSNDGPGAIRTIIGTDPAAAAEITETVPTDARWRLISLRAVLATDATVSNRIPAFAIDDGTTEFFRGTSSNNQIASTAFIYTFSAVGERIVNANSIISIPSPVGLVMLAGQRIVTVTLNLQAGDNWGAPGFAVEEWIED